MSLKKTQISFNEIKKEHNSSTFYDFQKRTQHERFQWVSKKNTTLPVSMSFKKEYNSSSFNELKKNTT